MESRNSVVQRIVVMLFRGSIPSQVGLVVGLLHRIGWPSVDNLACQRPLADRLRCPRSLSDGVYHPGSDRPYFGDALSIWKLSVHDACLFLQDNLEQRHCFGSGSFSSPPLHHKTQLEVTISNMRANRSEAVGFSVALSGSNLLRRSGSSYGQVAFPEAHGCNA